MNHNVSRGKWKYAKGETRKAWGKLTKEDLEMLEEEQFFQAGTQSAAASQQDNDVDRIYTDYRNAPGD